MGAGVCVCGCACDGEHQKATAQKRNAEALAFTILFLRASLFRVGTIPRAKENSMHNKKAPRDTQGLCGLASSREKRRRLRRWRVAWLTADSADYSGGTAADSHGLPHFPSLQIGNSVYAALPGVSMHGAGSGHESERRELSDFSNLACASPRAREDPLANLRGDRVR